MIKAKVKNTPILAGIIAGCGHRSNGYIEPFYGYMAEFAYFNRELTSTEINEIITNGIKGITASFMSCNRGIW